jgi:hypothetical protein
VKFMWTSSSKTKIDAATIAQLRRIGAGNGPGLA